MPEISVIIPTCSPHVPLEACLRSLVRQTLHPDRYEILVVNNGGVRHSNRFLRPILEQFEDRVWLVESKRNLGYGGGCRLGVEHAKGQILAFHNDDSMADPTWLALALAEFDQVPDLGVATCRVVSMNGPVLQHEGSSMTHPHGLFWQTGYGTPDTSPSLKDAVSVDLEYFGGCIWATTREVWERVGGLAPAYYPGYYEDSEYALRCRQLGYRIRLLKAVTCSHIMNATLGPQAARFWRVFHRSRYLFLLRNHVGYSWKEIIRSELGWWCAHRAGYNPGLCLAGFLSALPRIPGALFERRQFGRRMKDEVLGGITP